MALSAIHRFTDWVGGLIMLYGSEAVDMYSFTCDAVTLIMIIYTVLAQRRTTHSVVC